jgi:polyribonucleotide nucleotidyltransferase
MFLSKKQLEELYSKMSLDEMAAHLKIAKSTLYYHMNKFGIKRRSKSDAQKNFIKTKGHQRNGIHHSDEAKIKISNSTRSFWDSDNGKKQKERLKKIRQSEWKKGSPKYKNAVINRLREAPRPQAGELSNFGKALAEFLGTCEKVSTCESVIRNHISDIILHDRKIVIELLLPINIYGDQEKLKLEARYDRLQKSINNVGYRMVLIEDQSNSISRARCQRVYEQMAEFFKDPGIQNIKIVS